MPIRLVCPSCSATLSVKGEYAGRAVKCPKCAGVIPAAPPAAASSPSKPATALPPEPEAPAPFEVLDEPAKPEGKVTGRPTGKPAAKTESEDLPDDEDDRPAKKKRAKEKSEDDEDDRPAKGKKKRGDDEDDDRPVKGKKKGGSKTPLIIGIVGFLLLTCCGGGAYGVYYFTMKAKQGLEDVAESLTEKNDKVTAANYQKLTPGMTLAEVEAILGKGKPAHLWVLNTAYEADTPANTARKMELAPKMDAGRLMVWRNRDDYLFVAFHNKPEADGKLQMKEFVPKGGTAEHAGEPDDAKFAKEHKVPPGKGTPVTPGKEVPITPKTKVQAEDLAREFKTDPSAAAAKYANKTFLVNGNLSNIEVTADGGQVAVIVEGADGVRISCTMKNVAKLSPFDCERGQRLVFEGSCAGLTAGVVSFKDCKLTEMSKRLSQTVTARALIDAYRTEAAGDAKYKGKPIEVDNEEVEKMTPDGTLILIPFGMIPGSKPPSKKIRVEYDPSYKVLVPKMKVGSLVRAKGICEGVKDGEIVISRGWIIPSYHLQNS